MRPRIKYPISTGVNVIARNALAAIAYVFVYASGANSLPSCPPSVNTGRKDTVITSNEKKRAGPTSCELSLHYPIIGVAPARSRCLCMFSIITMAASTIAPIAMAIPPSDMMFARDTLLLHNDESSQNPDGQGNHCHQGRTQVEQEQQANQRYCQ